MSILILLNIFLDAWPWGSFSAGVELWKSLQNQHI